MDAPRTSDCVVLGGGLIGCAIAWRLAQRGLAPLVVDPGPPGGEASSAAAGILAPQIEAAGPGPLLDLGLAARARYPALVAELEASTGVHLGYRRTGALQVAAAPSELEALASRHGWQHELGLAVERLGPEAVRELEPALGECAGALHFPDEAQIEPPLLVRALELRARSSGVRFLRGRALRVHTHGGAVTGVAIDDGRGELTVATGQVVVAAGSWSSLIEGDLLPRAAVRPMRGQLVELEARSAVLRRVVFGAGGYLVPRADGRVVVGSTMELAGYRKEVTAAGLGAILALALRLAPSLGEAEVKRTWSGLRPYTEDHLPLLGPTSIGGLHLATGHFRNGILLCPVTAETVAAGVLGQPSPIDLRPFSVDRMLQ